MKKNVICTRPRMAVALAALLLGLSACGAAASAQPEAAASSADPEAAAGEAAADPDADAVSDITFTSDGVTTVITAEWQKRQQQAEPRETTDDADFPAEVALPESEQAVCPACGEERTLTLVDEGETRTDVTDCIHYIRGDDIFLTPYRTYQFVCENPNCEAPEASQPWQIQGEKRQVCMGHG